MSGTVTTPAITLGGTSLQTTLDSKANINSPNFTGVAGFDAISIGSSIQAPGVVTPTISDPLGGNVIFGNGLTASGTITAPSVKSYVIQTSSGTATYGSQVTDTLDVRNTANQSLMTLSGATKLAEFAGNISCNTMIVTKYDQITVGASGTPGDLTVWGNCDLKGNVTIGGYMSVKPYIALRLGTDFTTGTYPRTPTIGYFGYLTSGVTVSRGTGSDLGFYQFTLSPPHPQGANAFYNVQLRSSSSTVQSITTPGAYPTINSTATGFTLWFRSPASYTTFNDASFYVYSIP